MKSLLLVAHGSRRDLSNEEVRQITDKIREQASQQFLSIECAFLELAEPSIPEGIDRCIKAGAETVVIFPYFLSAGRHVSIDIPEIIEKKQAEYQDKTIQMVKHMGAMDGVAALILEHLS